MEGFLVVIDPGFDRELKQLQRAGHQDTVDQILAVLPRLVEDPVTRRPGLDARTMGVFRREKLRLKVGDLYIFYEVDREERTAIVTTVSRGGQRWRRS
ncbi:MAG: hypothetical protein E6K18_03195 [Methanobacteriota archaeon]|nr:MAG: hypothetical protein E6K18_03195 [Euryarchaeota archaeon]